MYRDLIARLEAKLRVLADLDAEGEHARVAQQVETVAEAAAALYEGRFEVGRQSRVQRWAPLGESLAALRAARQTAQRRLEPTPVSARQEPARRPRRPAGIAHRARPGGAPGGGKALLAALERLAGKGRQAVARL